MKSIALIWILLLAGFTGHSQQKKNVRLNGIYIYDNGIREFKALDGAHQVVFNQLKGKFSTIKGGSSYIKSDCVPSGAIGQGVGDNSLVEVLLILSDGYSISFATPCRDKKAWEEITALYTKVTTDKSLKDRMKDGKIVWDINNKFYIRDSRKMQFDEPESSSYFTAYKDSIVESVFIPAQMEMDLAEMGLKDKVPRRKVYRLYSASTLPPAFIGGIRIKK